MEIPRCDVVIVGGGHNALVAAAYLARAGKDVTVLERRAEVGGAAVSSVAFPGVAARLSRYSYLVSLLPARIIRELGLSIRLTRRAVASYTPLPATDRGLLVDHSDPAATDASFASIGAAGDADAWRRFYADTARAARVIFPSICEPLPTRSELRSRLGDDKLWAALVDEPIGRHIESSLSNDLVRGVVFTDALVGTFAPVDDASLRTNRCFLYHVIGNGTGDWDVPVGGMGAVSAALERVARAAGARILTGAEVTSVTPDGAISYRYRDGEHQIGAWRVLSGVAPAVLERLVRPDRAASELVGGAQVKLNLVVRRLPRLRDRSLDPAIAFGGTFHINETYSQLEAAWHTANAGAIAQPVPAEVYCHSLADPSILSPELAASGAHTLTVFALQTPHRLVADGTRAASAGNHEAMRGTLQRAVLASLNSVLAEPIEELLVTDADGRPAIETKTTQDLEDELGLPGGNIFHAPLSWPFAADDAVLDSAAKRWGVQTEWPRILLCGAGAQRGGGVSGIGGHNAAMAVLESDRERRGNTRATSRA